MIDFPDNFQLVNNRYNWFKDENDSEAVRFVEEYNALFDRIDEGSMYIKFRGGDRAGSIAKIKFNREKYSASAFQKCKIVYARSDYDYKTKQSIPQYRLENTYFQVVAYWDKRKNKVQLSLPNRDVVFLPNYDGPTIYEMFDHKAAKEAALNEVSEVDIDGNILKIGDQVLYINARYGSAFELCHGTVKEFKAAVDSRKKEITTVIERLGDGVLSSISSPHTMVYKK